MRIILLEITCPDIRAYGVRCLSSYLKKFGHQVNIIFLPPEIERRRFSSGRVPEYDNAIIRDVIEICQDAPLVGISFMTYYFHRAIQLTKALKESLDIPIIWGGVHPSTRPEECLEYADIVCLGEGEEALLELVEKLAGGMPYFHTQNLWFKKQGEIIKNPLRPLIQDLDNLPFPDHDWEDHYALCPGQNRVHKLNEDLLKTFFSMGPLSPLGNHFHYKTMASRGCPHRCAFCCESIYQEMYPQQKYLRRRGVEDLIQEILYAKEKMKFINAICFFDDSFLAAKGEEIIRFSEIYKERIRLPFSVQCSPPTTTEEKIASLVESGMVHIEMGIQTGSKRIQELYHRHISNGQILQAAKIINKYKDKILPPDYHFILDCPWETSPDVLETLKLILALPRPFGLITSSLVLYPGTGIYHKGKEEGLIVDEQAQVYQKAFAAITPSYLNFLIYLAKYRHFPRWLLRLMIRQSLVKLLNKDKLSICYIFLTQICEFITLLSKGVKALVTADFGRISRYLSKKT